MKRIVAILAFLIVVVDAIAQTVALTNVAGTGVAGLSGDDGPATSAQLNGPYDVAVDSAGNFYIADWYNNRIRKVNVSSGVITTIAGTGLSGSSADGVAATSAGLDHPEGVAVDAAGNIYISDSFNNRVRKVSTSGVITTIAGTGAPGYSGEGPALSATLNDPAGVAVDSAGNVYIADQSSHRVRKVSGGMITTIAGTGVAGFSGDGGRATEAQIFNPVHLAFDPAGNLYIADSLNNRIRKVNMQTGIITTVAGNGKAGFSGDGGPATQARLNDPTGVAITASGDVYIADAVNKRVRKVNASGFISTVAGASDAGCSTSSSLGFPLAVATDRSAGRLYIADYEAQYVRVLGVTESTPPPTLSSLTPASGFQGTSLSVSLNGSRLAPAADCSSNVIDVTVSGAGIKVGKPIVNDDSTVTVTLTIAANADLGPHDVTITNNRGVSNPLQFTVNPPPPIPIPRLTSMAPNTADRGTTVSVSLTGSDFGADAAAAKLAVSGTGITVSNVNLVSQTALTATFTIASTAAVLSHDVTVTTAGGPSNPVQFTVTRPPIPVPHVTSISPASGMRGAKVSVTLTGSDFGIGAGATSVSVSGTGIVVSDVTVSSTSSLIATLSLSEATSLGSYGVTVTTEGGPSNQATFDVSPQAPQITFGIPQTLNPTQQVPVQLTLNNPSPDALTGQLTLTFTPNAITPADDPSVTFINTQANSRTMTFTFPANQSSAQFSLSDVGLKAGTVAGTIQLALDGMQVGGHNVASVNPNFDVTIPRVAPVISSVRIINRTSTGFDVEIIGFSTSRDITEAAFEFTAASGAKLDTKEIRPTVSPVFLTYYQSAASAIVGSAFIYVQPFHVDRGDSNAVGSISVTLSNVAGRSLSKTAQ